MSAVLSADQKKRLDQLVIQMRGPIVMVEDPEIASELQLSEKQRAEQADTVKHYQKGLAWLQGRYGRKQIGGLRVGETLEDRKKELGAMFVVIRAIERERDADLLVGLTPEQLRLWRKIQGKPFPIAWPPTSVSDSPFEK